MAEKRKTTPKKKTVLKRINPYVGYRIDAKLRGRKFVYRGEVLDAQHLTEKQLDTLASDPKFKHITKRTKKDD